MAATPRAFGGGGSGAATATATGIATATAATAPAAGVSGVFENVAPSTPVLDAVTIALNQACEGGNKSWYVSTLELQLVSLEFCRACRSVPILHVRVEDATPRSLWSTEPVTHTNTRSWKLRNSRVPTVCARSLSWAVLTRAIAMELWVWLKCLRLGGSFAVADLGSVIWPRGIKELAFDTDVDTPAEAVSWPSSLEHITFGGSFNKPIVGVAWPAPMKSISFGDHFDQPIAGVVWLAPLQHLSFGRNFNQPIADVLCSRNRSKGFASGFASTNLSSELGGQLS